ncbi:spindle pole body component [Lineolata rhizophorae]|uniref:Spindle pole body component n=1 Tax=Lineolata rhizophorae TaxID=578093 RepID=A0A6A6PEX0_9PEZI|nr:spindle pole body component [Lineolata rhizophorae]
MAMSSYSNARPSPGTDQRRPAQGAAPRSRVPSSAPDSERAPRRPAGVSERRTDRTSTLSRETMAMRSRNPLAQSNESRVNSRKAKEANKASRPATPAASTKKTEEEKPKRWTPCASIIPHTTAPLASRVSVPPLAQDAPESLQPVALGKLSLKAQESVIVEDLMFVFMGFEGQYVRYARTYNPHEEKDKLVGPSFQILHGLDPSLRDLTTSMLKVASHYMALEAFVEVQSREEFGAVNHALCAAVRKLLKDYLILIGQLEHQMLTNATFTLHQLNLHLKTTSHMLFQLYNLGQELLKANSILEDDADDSLDDTDNFEDILESLKEGGNFAQGVPGKKMCKGGNVLGLITKRLASMSGDPAARTLLTTLLSESSRPYMTMLNEWLHHGGIKDPHAEFLIKEQKSIKRERLDQDYTDEYWEKRYTIRDNLVPPQLEGVKDKVLLAGKYLNVVRECGGVDVSKAVTDVPTSFDDPRFLENVNGAYVYANSTLLDLLLTKEKLPERLRSLKHYFFLDRSDFFSYFLELGDHELQKPVKNVNVSRLQSLLEIVLRQSGSVAAEFPYKEDVKIVMNEDGLTNWLMKIVNVTGLDQDAATGNITNYLTPAAQTSSVTNEKDISGFEALVFDYAVPFPLSLVVSRVTLTRYQLLFRYLLSLRHLEMSLTNSWKDHCKSLSWRHRSSNRKIEIWKRKAWTLRARMLVFVQQLLYYCTAEVIEPNWQGLMSRLSISDETRDVECPSTSDSKPVKRTVDELMQDHVDFLASCLKECMLTNSKLLRINSKILSTCTMFTKYTKSLSRYLAAADPDFATENGGTNAASQSTSTQYDPSKLDTIIDVLQKYEDNFTRHLKVLLDTLNYLAATETVVFLSLCARLSTASVGSQGQMDAMYE